MVDLQRAGVFLGRLVVRGVEAFLAAMVVLSIWILKDVPQGPGAPEQAGSLAMAGLLTWGMMTALLVLFLVVHGVVNGARLAAAEDVRSLGRPAGRIAAEVALGVALVVGLRLVEPFDGDFALVLAATAALAWAVLVHFTVDTVQFGRALAASG